MTLGPEGSRQRCVGVGGWVVGLLPAAGADVWMVFLPSWIPRNTRLFLRGAGVHLLINLGIVLSGQPLVEKKILEGPGMARKHPSAGAFGHEQGAKVVIQRCEKLVSNCHRLDKRKAAGAEIFNLRKSRCVRNICWCGLKTIQLM